MKIVMLLRKNGAHDTRVWKEASFLQDCGHEVIVLANQDDDYPGDGNIEGVFYKRVADRPLTVHKARDKFHRRRDKLTKRCRRTEKRIRRLKEGHLSNDEASSATPRPAEAGWRWVLTRCISEYHAKLTRLYQRS